MKRLTNTQFFLGAVFAVTFLLSGCGGGVELPGDAGTVSGTIKFKGDSAPAGTTVIMMHAKLGMTATGKTDRQGQFTLEMRGKTDILVGDYQVAIIPPENSAAEAPVPSDNIENTPAISEPESWKKIPKKYRDQNSSGETFTVKTGPNTYTLDMTDVAAEKKE